MNSGDYIPPGHTVVGSCSLCGGPVLVPTVWMSVQPAVPQCYRCGAVRADNHGPVIPMVPSPPHRITFGSTTDATALPSNPSPHA